MDVLMALLGIIIAVIVGIAITTSVIGVKMQEECENIGGKFEFVECQNTAGIDALSGHKTNNSECGTHCWKDGKDIFANLTAI